MLRLPFSRTAVSRRARRGRADHPGQGGVRATSPGRTGGAEADDWGQEAAALRDGLTDVAFVWLPKPDRADNALVRGFAEVVRELAADARALSDE
ncbi:hypothetical protein ACFU6I_14205 [Streptomyces sp. NPDC057486]|uniref:hypothetical protein n=1 Tax=Streptomyces sp. NPDC057486 TaxID=3346145 RepID=UPI00368B4FB2